MNKRPAYPARGWLYCAATSLLLMGPTMVHAQANVADDSTTRPTVSRTTRKTSTRKTKKVNPLFSAVKRELSKLKLRGKKPTTTQAKTTKKKTAKSKPGLFPIFSLSKSKTAATPKKKSSVLPIFSVFSRSRNSVAPGRTRQPIRQVAGDQPLPSLDKQPDRRLSTRSRKPRLIDRLLGRGKPKTKPRTATAQQDVPKKSHGIPGLLPSFLKLKSKQQATARRLPTRLSSQRRTASTRPVINNRAVPAPKLDDLDNAFPEFTEAEADKTGGNLTAELTETKPGPKEANPFTGIKLDEPKETVQAASGTSEETPAIGANSAPPLPLDSAGAPQTDPEENAHEDKLKLLADREARGGLKGFCPVALRDHRDLIDADPEITSNYANKTYHFSTIEAKDSFDADPAKYAPIHNGNDVIVLTEGSVELEGTLENAVWFKDRLYLFSSEATLETFVGNPARYAANSPEESTENDTATVDDTDTQNNTDPFDDVELPYFDDEASTDEDSTNDE